MVKFENVIKKYPGEIVALDGVSFSLDKGEFTFVVGPSGAGKSTLIRLLIRQEMPTDGKIYFEDLEVTTIPTNLLSIYRQQLGVVFQDLKLIPSKTVFENISFALEISGKHRDEVFETTQYLLDAVNLTGRSNLFPSQLSGGEKQKVAIARALANDPKVFIADEPTGNLDSSTAFEILNILKTINDWGTTVLVITHDKNLVESKKGRIIEMESGKIIKDNKKHSSKSDVVSDRFIDTLETKVKHKLYKAEVTSVERLLEKTDRDLENIGLSAEQIEELNSSLQTYLSTHNDGTDK